MRKAVRILKKGEKTPLFPFLRSAAGLPVLGATLLEHQRKIIRAADLEFSEVLEGESFPKDAAFVFAEDAFFDGELLQWMLSLDGVNQVRLAPDSSLGRFSLAFLDDVSLPIWSGRIRDWADLDSAVAVLPEDRHAEIRVDPHGRLQIPTGPLAGRYAHWLHVLNLNQALLQKSKQEFIPAASAEVHGTAYVESSFLAEGVHVEHHASVIDSYIGKNTKIGDHAVVHGCVIGDNSKTLVDTHLRRIVSGQGCTLSNLGMEDALIGDRVFMTTGVAFFRESKEGNVRVDGLDTGRPVLGGAFGDESVLGARALFSCGTALPSKTMVVLRPDEAVRKIDQANNPSLILQPRKAPT